MAEPEWGDFKYVLALSSGGSVAGAARELGVDNSTVSRRLAALEESIGASLFLRDARELTLTPEGKAAVAAAQSIAEAVARACTQVRASKQGIEGSVRISCVGSMVLTLVPVLSVLRASYPALRIEVLANDQMSDLSKGEADIAVRMVRPSAPDIIARKSIDFGWGLYASQDYVAKHGMLLSIEDLRQHWLIPYAEQFQRQPALAWFEEFLNPDHSTTRVGSPEAAIGIAAAGAGIALVPCQFADTQSPLVRIYADPVKFITVWIAYHETMRDTARVRVVADALQAFFAERARQFRGTR